MAHEQEVGTPEPVGKSAMDAEHELLHQILDELKAELASGGERVPELLDRFDLTARAHFLEEQSLMRLHAYPGYEPHKNEHDELVEELRRLAERIEGGDVEDAARMAEGLDRWLNVHQSTTDAAFETYTWPARAFGPVERAPLAGCRCLCWPQCEGGSTATDSVCGGPRAELIGGAEAGIRRCRCVQARSLGSRRQSRHVR